MYTIRERERERERERKQIQSQQSQLHTEIMQLEQNPTSSNQTELDSKKQQLKDLQSKEKALTKSLPIDIQITILQKEIKVLESKSNKKQVEEALLADKKKELEELLKKQSNSNSSVNNRDKENNTALYIGCGIVGLVLVGLVIVLVKKSKKKKKNIKCAYGQNDRNSKLE